MTLCSCSHNTVKSSIASSMLSNLILFIALCFLFLLPTKVGIKLEMGKSEIDNMGEKGGKLALFLYCRIFVRQQTAYSWVINRIFAV